VVNDPELFTKTKLEELASDPTNLVYEYEYDTPDNKKDSKAAMSCLTETRSIYAELRNWYPDWSDEQIREHVLLKEHFRDFKQSHPTIFQACTSRKTTTEQFSYQVFMIYMLEMQEKGLVSPEEGNQRVREFLIEKFKRGAATPEEIAKAKTEQSFFE